MLLEALLTLCYVMLCYYLFSYYLFIYLFIHLFIYYFYYFIITIVLGGGDLPEKFLPNQLIDI